MKPKKFSQKKVIKALEGTGGIISALAKNLDCTWLTAQAYIKNFPKVERAWLDEKEKILDIGEGALYALVSARDLGAVKYLLSTLGKKRGFVIETKQKVETDVTIKEVPDLVIIVEDNKKNVETED
jgi:hypothetical protein